jgi:hypothetical protein
MIQRLLVELMHTVFFTEEIALFIMFYNYESFLFHPFIGNFLS